MASVMGPIIRLLVSVQRIACDDSTDDHCTRHRTQTSGRTRSGRLPLDTKQRLPEIFTNDVDADVDFAGWEAKTGTLVPTFIDFF